MPRTKDQAICIRHLDWSETSQVVVLLTENHGKLRGLAKGSKRMTPSSIQRYSGGIELLTRGEIVWVSKPGVELATLTEWDLQDDHHHLRRDLASHRLAMYAADVCNAVLADHDALPRTYAALRVFLEALREGRNPGEAAAAGSPGFGRGTDASSGAPPKPADAASAASARSPQAALLRFQWEALDDAGYRPELFRDAATGGELGDEAMYAFDPKAGGLTAAGRVGGQDWRVRRATVEALRAAASRDGSSFATPEPDAVARANKLLCVYLRTILDQELPTMRLLLDK